MTRTNYAPGVAAAELQKLWALSFEKTTRGIAIIDPGERIMIAVNPAFAEMHGGRPEDFVGRPILDSLGPDSGAGLPEFAARVDLTGFGARESDHVRLDGTTFRVATEAMTARDEEGNLLYRIAWFTDVSEQHRLEKQRLEAERQFETAFTSAAIGMGMVGLNGRWLRANPALSAITGYQEEELRRLTFAEMTHRADLEANFENDERLLAGEVDDYQLEKRYIRKDGKAIWVKLAVSLARDEDGGATHYIVHVEDISLRKRMEEDFSQATVGAELSRDLMCTIRFGGSLDRLDGRWPEVLGWSREELLSRPVIDFLHPGDRAAMLAELDRFSGGGEPRHFRNRWKTRSGGWSWLLWSAAANMGEGRIFCAVREANDQIANEQALGLRGQVIANMVDGVCLVTSANTQIVYANPSLERMLGYESGELAGRDAVSVMRPTDLTEAEEQRRHEAELTLRESGAVTYEGRRVRKNGEQIWCRTTTSAFEHPTYGDVWVTVHKDVTEERRAREAAAELERAKREFLGSVSHELRTPLTSILGYTALLRADAGGPAETLRAHVEVIERNAGRQLRLVEDLLDIARIEAGEFELRSRPFDLNELIGEEVEALGPDVEQAGLTIEISSDGPLQVRGDADRLALVLTNLISNSIKFTPAGGRIVVGLRSAGANVLMSVEDSGPGVQEAELPHLFERLYRGERFKERQVPGAGLGLAISRSIVEAHSGRIEVRDSDLGGASFEVALPAH